MLRRIATCAHYGCQALMRPTVFSAPATTMPRLFSSTGPSLVQRKATKTKLKTHKGTAKRWFAIAGAFKRSRAGKVHLNSSKGAKRVNKLGLPAYSTNRQTRLLKKLLPYHR